MGEFWKKYGNWIAGIGAIIAAIVIIILLRSFFTKYLNTRGIVPLTNPELVPTQFAQNQETPVGPNAKKIAEQICAAMDLDVWDIWVSPSVSSTSKEQAASMLLSLNNEQIKLVNNHFANTECGRRGQTLRQSIEDNSSFTFNDTTRNSVLQRLSQAGITT
ncbi:MAG: hypothetical protein QXR53_05095 [Candidatus Norongarragalinales archaeon]